MWFHLIFLAISLNLLLDQCFICRSSKDIKNLNESKCYFLRYTCILYVFTIKSFLQLFKHTHLQQNLTTYCYNFFRYQKVLVLIDDVYFPGYSPNIEIKCHQSLGGFKWHSYNILIFNTLSNQSINQSDRLTNQTFTISY